MIPILSIEEKMATHYKVRANAVNNSNVLALNEREVDICLNTYYYFDSYADVLVPGVCKKSIQEHGPESPAGVRKIKFAKSHDLTKLPGKFRYLNEEEVNGKNVLRGIAKLTNTTLGNDTLEEYRDEIWDNHSIGFNYRQLTFIDKASEDWNKWLSMLINPEDANEAGFMYLVKEINLFEGSPVAIGANELTETYGLKSDGMHPFSAAIKRMQTFERMLKKGDSTPETIETLYLQIKQIMQILSESERPGNNTTERPELITTEKQRYDFEKMTKFITNL